MDTNNESSDTMDELSVPDNVSLPDANEKRINNNNIQNGNFPQNGFNGNIQNGNFSQNGFNGNIQNGNFPQNGFNGNIQNGNFPQNGFNGNIQNGNFPQNGFNGNIQNRNFPQNGFNGNIQNRNFPQNGFNGNIQNRNFPQNGSFPANRSSAPPRMNSRPNQAVRQRVRQKRPLSKEDMTKLKVKQYYNRTGVCLLIHDVLIFIIQIFLGIVLAFSSIALRDVKDYLADESISVGTAIASVLSLVAANIICAFLGLSLTKRVKEFPKLYCAPKVKFPTALLAFPAIFGFQGVIAILHKGYFIIMNLNTSSETTAGDMNKNVVIVYFIYSVILAPVTEEILFRGMVLKNLTVIDEKFAIFFSAFLFGLFHENVLQMITATLLGIFLAYVAVKTDSIILPTLLHMFNNLYAEAESMFPESKTKTAVLFTLYGIGIIAAVLFYIFTRKQETAQNNYKPVFETLPSEEKGLKLSAALSAPAIIVYLILIMVMLSFEMIITFLVSWFA